MVLLVDRLTGNDDGATITVPVVDGSTTTVQAVYNAIRAFEAVVANMDVRLLTNSKTSGKEPLGGGNVVAITLQLLNRATILFEARAGPAVIPCSVGGGNLTANLTWVGTVTTPDAGTVLIDSAATFARNGIQSGDVIRNVTDGSTATVTTVDSEIQITHTALSGGTEDDWDAADVWEVDSRHPFTPTAFVHIAFAQDTAPVAFDLTSLPVADAAHLAAAYVQGSTDLRIGVWLDRNGVTVLTPTSATVTWFDPDGTQLFQVVDSSPDANGHFEISLTQALVINTAYYAIVSVTDATGTVTTRRGVPSVGQ